MGLVIVGFLLVGLIFLAFTKVAWTILKAFLFLALFPFIVIMFVTYGSAVIVLLSANGHS